jgi:hypothetical protein
MLAFPKEVCCNRMTSSLSCSKWSVFFSINLCTSLLILINYQRHTPLPLSHRVLFQGSCVIQCQDWKKMHATALRRTQSLSCCAHPCGPSALGWWAWRVSSESPVPVLSSPTAWQTNQCLFHHISSSKLKASPQIPTWYGHKALLTEIMPCSKRN